MKTSATRLNLTTPEQLKKYENLSFTQRLKLADLEIKGKDKFTDADIARIQSELDNPESSELGGFAGEVVSNILGAFGINVGKDKTTTTPDTSTKPPEAEKQDVGAFKSEKRDTFIEGAKEGGKKVIDKINQSTPEGEKQAASAKEELDKVVTKLEEYPTLGFKEGALVTKPKRKPKAKRKSLGQKIK